MEWLHALIAVFAAFRLTTLFVSDTLWNWPRRKFPRIPWHCALCMSVWGGALATLILVFVPWLNWPLAFSWLYLAYHASKESKEKKPMNDPEITIKLPVSKMNVIMGALGERPLKEVLEVWLAIKQQGEEQARLKVVPIEDAAKAE